MYGRVKERVLKFQEGFFFFISRYFFLYILFLLVTDACVGIQYKNGCVCFSVINIRIKSKYQQNCEGKKIRNDKIRMHAKNV